MNDMAPYLTLNVPPDEMVKYIQDLMTLPHGEIAASSALALAQRHWGGDTRWRAPRCSVGARSTLRSRTSAWKPGRLPAITIASKSPPPWWPPLELLPGIG